MDGKRADRKKWRRRSKAERRRIVEETFESGISVAVVARAHGVNANQVFAWRKLYREGRLEVDRTESALLPVRVSEPPKKQGRPSGKPRPPITGIIDIDLGHARLRIQGEADPACVRAALEGLRR